MIAAQTPDGGQRPAVLRQHVQRWVSALSDGLIHGFGSPALRLAIQAQLPAQAPATPQAQPLKGAQA